MSQTGSSKGFETERRAGPLSSRGAYQLPNIGRPSNEDIVKRLMSQVELGLLKEPDMGDQ